MMLTGKRLKNQVSRRKGLPKINDCNSYAIDRLDGHREIRFFVIARSVINIFHAI